MGIWKKKLLVHLPLVSKRLEGAKNGCKKGVWHRDRHFPIENALETFPHFLGHLWSLITSRKILESGLATLHYRASKYGALLYYC
jgi:hypothetical protein